LLKDPASFFIPWLIGDVRIDWALCDLGSCISLMPCFIYKTLDLG